jgi:hypothetical protein
MQKPLRPHWLLQAQINEKVEALAPGLPIVPIVQNDDDQIVWDEECKGVGRSPWTVGYFIPLGHPARALVPILDAAIAPLQARFDLGVTCDCLTNPHS